MDKFSLFLLLFLIIASCLYLYLFYFYLYIQYKKAETKYYDKKISTKRHFITEREKSKNRIKNNVTTIIDSELINNMAGYAIIEFINECGTIIKTHTIRKSYFKIGRHESNDIVLRGQTVSRYQCSIICKNNTFIICNLSHSNPTILNNTVIDGKKELFFDDIIKIANYTFRFREIEYESKPNAG